jgi:hypothetical protein
MRERIGLPSPGRPGMLAPSPSPRQEPMGMRGRLEHLEFSAEEPARSA